ncbi:MAG: hypothetical protein ABSD38_12400 [Syntrophorhabdales bacterium]
MIDGTAGGAKAEAERAADGITEYLRVKLGKELHYGEIAVMWEVTGKNGISLADIAEAMECEEDTVMEILTGMVTADKNMITLCHGDGGLTAWLTPEGQSIAKDLDVIFHSAFEHSNGA